MSTETLPADIGREFSNTHRLSFELPAELEATAPAEERGLRRDGVRMLVAERTTGRLTHSTSTPCRRSWSRAISSSSTRQASFLRPFTR